MKKNTVIVEEFDPDTNQISTRGTVGFVSWNGELLELQFENGTFTFEPDLAHRGDERSRTWASVGERGGFGLIRIGGLLEVLRSHGL